MWLRSAPQGAEARGSKPTCVGLDEPRNGRVSRSCGLQGPPAARQSRFRGGLVFCPGALVNSGSCAASARPLRLACIGHAALDHVFQIRAFPGHPTKTPAQAYAMQPGGMALNASIAAARLGASVRLLGRVGEDDAAAFLRRRLIDEQVEVGGLETVAGAVTSVSAIAVDARGERQIYNHRGDALERAHALDQRQLAGADIVLADPRWRAGAASALRWAREQGLPSVLDADIAPREDLCALVALARWAVFSEPGLHCFAPGVEAKAALALALNKGCDVAVVTRGARSVLWMRRGIALQEMKVPQIKARDTLGAGDVFHAALAVALGEGMTESRAVAFAVAAAALKCKNGQGAFGAPSRVDLARHGPAFAGQNQHRAARQPAQP